MTAPWKRRRAARYASRAHDVETRLARPDLSAAPAGTFIWYRGADGDHAFAAASGWIRSACSDVRWDVRMHVVEGTAHACAGCLAKVEPGPVVAAPPESEQRAAWGDR